MTDYQFRYIDNTYPEIMFWKPAINIKYSGWCAVLHSSAGEELHYHDDKDCSSKSYPYMCEETFGELFIQCTSILLDFKICILWRLCEMLWWYVLIYRTLLRHNSMWSSFFKCVKKLITGFKVKLDIVFKSVKKLITGFYSQIRTAGFKWQVLSWASNK